MTKLSTLGLIIMNLNNPLAGGVVHIRESTWKLLQVSGLFNEPITAEDEKEWSCGDGTYMLPMPYNDIGILMANLLPGETPEQALIRACAEVSAEQRPN